MQKVALIVRVLPLRISSTVNHSSILTKQQQSHWEKLSWEKERLGKKDRSFNFAPTSETVSSSTCSFYRPHIALWESFNGRCNICISLRIFNFASHFFRVQIFQLDLFVLLFILSVSKYSRYICGGRNEQLSILLCFIPQERNTFHLKNQYNSQKMKVN